MHEKSELKVIYIIIKILNYMNFEQVAITVLKIINEFQESLRRRQ